MVTYHFEPTSLLFLNFKQAQCAKCLYNSQHVGSLDTIPQPQISFVILEIGLGFGYQANI